MGQTDGMQILMRSPRPLLGWFVVDISLVVIFCSDKFILWWNVSNVIVVACDPNCSGGCKDQGATKCDSQCKNGYSLITNDFYMTYEGNYTCVST